MVTGDGVQHIPKVKSRQQGTAELGVFQTQAAASLRRAGALGGLAFSALLPSVLQTDLLDARICGQALGLFLCTM